MNWDACAVEGCDGYVVSRGYCRFHYDRWRRGAALDKPRQPRQRRDAICTVDGCNAPHFALGYCMMHYARVRRHGDPHHVFEPRTGCDVPECTRPHLGHGFCKLHLYRWHKHGDPKVVGRKGLPEFPTPHDQLTYAGWNATAFPTPPFEAINKAAADRYAAANERDGYLTDPDYLAAVAAWRAGDLPDALPMAAD